MTGMNELNRAASNLQHMNANKALDKLTELGNVGTKYNGRLRNEGTFGHNASASRKDLRQTMDKLRDAICGSDKQLLATWNANQTWGKYKLHDLTGAELKTLANAMKQEINDLANSAKSNKTKTIIKSNPFGPDKTKSTPDQVLKQAQMTSDRPELNKYPGAAWEQTTKTLRGAIDKFKWAGGRKVIQYHATKKQFLRRNPKSSGILNEGLQPRHGGSGAAQADPDLFEDNSKAKVHFTANRPHADDYKTMFETGTHPGNEELEYEDTAPAETMKIAMTKDQYERSQKDPDDGLARTLSEQIHPDQIRSAEPQDLPGARENNWVAKTQYEDNFRSHQVKGQVENEALYSWLPQETRDLLSEFTDLDVALQMFKQGIKSTQAVNRSGNVMNT